MSFSSEELEEFKNEAIDLLDIAEKSLLQLDGSSEFKRLFDTIFRSLHNLKGASGMMELFSLQSHTHELETILMSFKSKDSIPKNVIDFFLKGIDHARAILIENEVKKFNYQINLEQSQNVEPTVIKSENKTSIEVNSEYILECEEMIERISKNIQLLENKNDSKDCIDELYRDIHSLKGGAYLLNFKNLGDLTHALESSLENVRSGTHFISKELINLLFKNLILIEKIMNEIKINKTDIPFTERVQVEIIQLLKTSNELNKVEVQSENQNLHSQENSEENEKNSTSLSQQSKNKDFIKDVDPSSSSIRVSVSLLDHLMTLMGEMVLVRNQVLQYSNKSDDLELLSMSKRLNMVTSEIQSEMMKTRMQSIGNVFSKFNRVVRDLATELNKSIELNIFGAETELDKSLLEAIKDPLTHIVRNSCDHGIETREERRKKGKSETGTLTIKSYHEGGQVVIEVSDDGKGLHQKTLLQKSIEKGLITEAQSLKMSQKEIFNLIFAPGFSTAAKVTNVSGRGVGMDVVRTNIERIGGTVELFSVENQGTVIKIKIPLTLAIIPALLVECGQSTFAIPQVKLEELVRVEQNVDQPLIEVLHGAPVFRLRGKILPLVDLNEVLKFSKDNWKEKQIINIAVLNADHFSFGLIIDQIHDTADIVVKPLNKLLKSLQIYSGATIRGDGTVSLILDVSGIAKVSKIGLDQKVQKESDLSNHSKINKEIESQEFLIFKLNSPTKHAIPLSYVNRLEEFYGKDIEYSGKTPVIRYRNQLLQLIYVNDSFGYSEKGHDFSTKEIFSVLVIHRGDSFYGLVVDEILDILLTQCPLDTTMSHEKYLFGHLNMKDELINVVDPFELILNVLPNEQKNESFLSLKAKNETNIKKHLIKNILLVEDTLFFRNAVAHVLQKNDCQVYCINNGEEAISFLNKNEVKIDCIISDIEMPKMNGLQLASHLKNSQNYSHIPLIAMSSRADSKTISDGKKSGFDIYLEKFKPQQLIDSLNELEKIERKVA